MSVQSVKHHANTEQMQSSFAGKTAKLFTYLSVREDAVELYGFATEAELSSFRMLLGVSGVGPKAALSVLSLLTPEKLIRPLTHSLPTAYQDMVSSPVTWKV